MFLRVCSSHHEEHYLRANLTYHYLGWCVTGCVKFSLQCICFCPPLITGMVGLRSAQKSTLSWKNSRQIKLSGSRVVWLWNTFPPAAAGKGRRRTSLSSLSPYGGCEVTTAVMSAIENKKSHGPQGSLENTYKLGEDGLPVWNKYPLFWF